MQTGQPSRTALGAARYRAEHQDLDGGRIFRDPLARAVIGDEMPARDHLHDDGRDRMRGFIATRSRFAEDALGDAVARGVGQAVILGAGLDTFGYRNPYPSLRVFEVDHPDTQSWKRERLSRADIAVPASVTFVPVDFERQRLDRALAAAGFAPARAAFVMWLGVTVYLTRAAVEETLGHLGRLAAGSEVVFDYGVPLPASGADALPASGSNTPPAPGSDTPPEPGPDMRAAIEERERRLAAAGERWISFFTPEQVADLLRDNGFTVVEDLAAAELGPRYLGREPATRLGPRLVRAEIRTDL